MSMYSNCHRCLDARDVIHLDPVDAYAQAEDCPLCKELVNFYSREKQRQSSVALLSEYSRPRLNRELLDKLLDRFDLFERGLVIHNFNTVITEFYPSLKNGDQVKLKSMGELLEANYPFAFSEIAKAVDRGVKFEYQIDISAKSKLDDAKNLRHMLECSLNSEVVNKHVKVTYQSLSLDDRKDVIYLGPDEKPKSRLLELAYQDTSRTRSSRLWLKIPEVNRVDFINELESIQASTT